MPHQNPWLTSLLLTVFLILGAPISLEAAQGSSSHEDSAMVLAQYTDPEAIADNIAEQQRAQQQWEQSRQRLGEAEESYQGLWKWSLYGIGIWVFIFIVVRIQKAYVNS